MGSRIVHARTSASALALTLALLLAMGAPLDAAGAYAADLQVEQTPGGGASQPLTSAEGAEGGSGDSGRADAPASEQVVEEIELSGGSKEPSEPVLPPVEPAPTANQTAADVPLAPETPKASTGELVQDGLVYRIDGETAALVGARASILDGEVVVPAAVSSGSDSYAVVALGDPDASEGVFDGCAVVSLSLPESIETIEDGALAGCPSLSRITVSSKNESFASFDGMLFTKDLTGLLLVPEGKEGVARVPDQTATVPASAFSHCARLSAVEVGVGSAAFASRNGLLYTNDMKTLVACPVGAGDAVVVPEGVESIGSGAFAGCSVASVTALGFVREIAADAFDVEARGSAVVALPAGEDYDARKAVWKAAGFEKFAEPARPGDVSAPEPSEPDVPQASGLAFEVLDDYTLAVSWQGAEGPEGDLEIPATAEVGGVSYRVSAIADAAFAGCSGLTGVTLPASVTSIGDRAFEATGISDVWLPASVATAGERAFAACPSLSRVVALDSPWVADSALAECSGVSIYAPSESSNPWNVGLPAAGNHLMPYGVELPEEPLRLEVGQSASLLEGGSLEAPEPVEVSYAYAAKPLSVDPDGTATGKAGGSSEVAVTLSLDNVELARATRTVEVAPAPAAEAPAPEPVAEPEAPVMEGDPAITGAVSLEPVTASEEEPGVDRDAIEPLSVEALLTTGASFESVASTGQTLKFDVLSEDEQGKTGTVSVSKANVEPTGALVIPATVEHEGFAYDVVSVGARGFFECNALLSVAFEGDKMLALGESSFDGCRGMSSIVLPEGLESLGRRSFANCGSLVSIAIPDSAKTFGDRLFLDASSLSEASLGAGYRSVSAGDFTGCDRLSRIVVGGGIASIDPIGFDYVPTESVDVFVSSDQARSLWLEASQTAGVKFAHDRVKIVGETRTVIFETRGGTPGVYAQSVPKGEPVAAILAPWKNGFSFAGWFTDEGCSSAWDAARPVEEDVTVYAKWVEEVRDGGFVFRMRADGASLSVAAENVADLHGNVVVPASRAMGGTVYPVVELAACAFSGASDLASIMLPDSVRVIGPAAFTDCTSLASFEIGETSALESLGFDAFSGCTSLEGVRLPASVESIGPGAFYGCVMLGTVDISTCSNLKTIKSGTFNGCVSLVSIALPDSLEIIEKNVFSRCALLDSVVLPASTKTIGSNTFSQCSSLASISLPDALTWIGENAFNGSGLRSIELPFSVESLAPGAFSKCAELVSATVDASVGAVPARLFSECPSLVSVSLGEGISEIASSAFKSCSALSSINLPLSLTKIAANAFEGCSSLSAVRAEGSMRSVDIASVFSNDVKSKATVVLPAKSRDGSDESFETMSGVWKTTHGFSKAVCTEGALPLESDAPGSPNADPTKAGWSLDADGALKVWSAEKLADFGWVYNDPAYRNEHWGPVRGFVKSVDTAGVSDVHSMSCWFRNMPVLTDITGFKVPESTKIVADVFTSDLSLSVIPETFEFPDGATSVESCFNNCTSIRELPSTFKLPSKVEQVGQLFGHNPHFTFESLPQDFFPDTVQNMGGFFYEWASLKSLPDDFKLPRDTVRADSMFAKCSALETVPAGLFDKAENVGNVKEMFYLCTSLEEVPEGFALSSSVTATESMFNMCTSLRSVPASLFSLSSSATAMRSTFYNCPSLLSLPDGFAIPANAETKNLFYLSSDFLVGGQKMPLHYAGDDPKLLTGCDWNSYSRVLVTPSSKPDGACSITLNVKAEGETGPGSYWTTAYTDGSGVLAEPAYAPSRPGMVFALWFADPECTQRVDFSQAFAEDATIYGKLVPGTRGGSLPTEAGTGSAFWSLANDGTLYIRGAGTISVFEGWPAKDWTFELPTGYWGDHRGNVTKIVMAPGLKAVSMNHWFAGMTNLEDVRDVFIPRDVTDISHLFDKCGSIESLPEGLTIPAGVGRANSAFRNLNVSEYPAGLALPDSLYEANSMFANGRNVATLPEGVTLRNTKVTNARYFLYNCPKLVSLPAGFGLPETRLDITKAFSECPSLASLPEGFTIPVGVHAMTEAFAGCTSLTELPASFDFEPSLAAASEKTFLCNVADGARVATYYAGTNPSVLNYDWESQNRTLVTDPADMGEWGMRQVKLQVQSPDEAKGFPWETRTVAWTDKQGVLADPGDPQLEGYSFTGWCTDESCLEPVDFSQPLPEGVDALYGKWVVAGGRGTEEGFLPVDDEIGSAWWSLTADGALNIECEEGASISNLNMTWNSADATYWQPYRERISSVNMAPDVRALSMQAWFRGMPRLVDVRKGFFIPDNCEVVQWMFYGCSSLRFLPEGFFPETNKVMAGVAGMLQNCFSLESLPADFTVPGTVKSTGFMLAGTAIEALPEKFSLPTELDDMSQMFRGCNNLKSLPESFVIPSSAYGLKEVFADCPNLVVLPSKLLSKVESERAKASVNDGRGMFGFNPGVAHDKPLMTFFAGSSAERDLVSWQAQDRIVVAEVPADRCTVELWLPIEGGEGSYLWKKLMAAQGAKLDAPAAPARVGSAFVGWYADPEFTVSAEFPLDVAGDTTLYAKYVATGGPLPTVGGEDDASWELSNDGTLSIRAGSSAIADFGWDENPSERSSRHWGPFVSKVIKVALDEEVTVESEMNSWFQGMDNLVDASEFLIPDGVASVKLLFNGCSSLESLPNGFTLPEGVTNAYRLFDWCTSLKSLPESFTLPSTLEEAYALIADCPELESLPSGFRLPDGLKNAQSMFYNDSKLKSLPYGFTLPSSIEVANYMFVDCTSLEALPQGFAIPEDIVATNFEFMFHGCSSLRSLPEGFDVPASATAVQGMFFGCTSLRSLPASLDISKLTQATRIENMFDVGDGIAGTLPTYYAGADTSRLAPPGAADAAEYWRSKYRRDLSAGVPPAGKHTVTFMLQKTGEDAPSAWQTVLVDDGAALARPADPYAFGYRFGGWKLRGADGSLADYDFGAPVASDLVLVGTLAMEVDVDVPIQAKATVDAAGTWSPGEVAFKSLTPATVRVSGVSGELAPRAGELFPSGANGVGLLVDAGSSLGRVLPGDASRASAGLSAELAPATPGAPSLLPCSIHVEPNGAQVSYQPGDGMTSFARLSWTIEVAVP